MSELALRPRSATELIDAAFQVYRRAPTPFILAVALVYVPWFILWTLLVGRRMQGLTSSVATAPPGSLPSGIFSILILSLLGSVLLYALVAGVVAALTRGVYLDEPTSVGGAFQLTFSRLGNLIVASFIQFVLVGIGFLFLFIPGFYLIARFFSVPQAVVLENAGPIAALGRSGALSKGHKWHILGTLVLVFILYLVIDGGVAIAANLLGSKIVANVILIAIATVVVPLFGITQTLLYFDSRIRNEGFDVEYLAGTPSSGTTSGLTA